MESKGLLTLGLVWQVKFIEEWK